MYYEDFFIEIMCGGVVQWCRTIDVEWHQHFLSHSNIILAWLEPVCKVAWVLRLIYYKTLVSQQLRVQVKRLQLPFYTVGVMSRSRGEHHKFSKRWRNRNS